MEKEELDILYRALRDGHVRVELGTNEYGHIQVLCHQGYAKLNQTGHAIVITPSGENALKREQVWAIEVEMPGTPVMVLRDFEELVDEIRGANLYEAFQLLEAGDYSDGDMLFTVKATRRTLHNLASLEFWDEIA